MPDFPAPWSLANEYPAGGRCNLQNTLDCCARLQREGDHSRAEEIYLKCLRDDLGNVKLTVALAGCLLMTGRLEEALTGFDSALARDPNAAGVRFRRAVALHRMGRQHDAVSELEIAQRREPDSAHIHLGLGVWRMQLNRDRTAISPQCKGHNESGVSQSARR